MAKSKKKENDRDRSWQERRKLIYVLPETKEKLKRFGDIGDTYNDAISKLIAFATEHRKKYDTFTQKK